MARYLCAVCNQRFDDGGNEADAQAEYVRLYGTRPTEDEADVACDDCYREMLADEDLGLGAFVASRTVVH